MDEGTSSSSSPVTSIPEEDARKDVIEALATTDIEYDVDGQPLVYAKSPYDANEDGEKDHENRLSLKLGDAVRVLNTSMGKGWWWVEVDGESGYVPSSFLGTEDDLRGAEEASWQNDEYFDQYATLKIHQEMLGDKPRTLAYQNAIKQCRADIEGKVVLDVGCGTGILSMMCARDGGAAKVYAVDASPLTTQVQKLVEANGLADRITVIRGKVEEIDIPEQVDLILSEWMGTFLLFEFMLESVLSARDLFLKPDGTLWPSQASLFLVPCSAADQADRVGFWSSLYGFDFSILQDAARAEYHRMPIFNHTLQDGDCLAEPKKVVQLNMKTTTADDLEEISSPFEFRARQDGVMHGFASWFDVGFCPMSGSFSGSSDGGGGGSCGEDSGDDADGCVRLSTSPTSPQTHWNQDLCMLDESVQLWTGDVVRGTLTLTRNAEWRRHMHVRIDYAVLRDNETAHRACKTWGLWKC
eukprot:scpid69193/ scgid19899/ Protein arginine N-methyltransferase 2; Histone-arginine N-methyltransferase PRMT2